MAWTMYVLKCCDESLYTGVTTDTKRRLHQHNHTKRGAKYTRARRPVELVAEWEFGDRSDACAAEYSFKQLTREQKIARIEET